MSDVLNTVVDKKAFEQIQQLEDGLRSSHQALLAFMKDAGGANININAKSFKDLDDQIKKSAEYQKQLNKHQSESDKIQKALENSRKSLAQALSKENKEIQANRLAAQQANKENKDLARISSTLAGAYARTSAQLNKMRGEYKDLAIRKQQGEKLTEKEIQQMQRLEREVSDLDRKLKQVDADAGQFQRSVGNYGKAWGKAGDLIRSAVAAFGVYSAADIGREIFEQIKSIDALNKSLEQVTETTEDYNQAQEYLAALAERTGIQRDTLQSGYIKFIASARETNLTLFETQELYENVATAGAVLGQSTEQVEGAMRALEQMLSKGKVQAEEIRGQLGERLPGAFNILAKSMGITTAELNKMLEDGKVIADEVLPGFGRELAKSFSLENVDRVQTLNAAQGRLSNSFNQVIRDMEEGNNFISKSLISTFDALAAKVKETGQELNELGFEINSTTSYFQSIWQDIKNATSGSKALDGVLNDMIIKFQLMKSLMTFSIFEAYAQGIKGVTTTFRSLYDGIGETFTQTRDFFSYLKGGEIDEAFNVVENANDKIADSFGRAWRLAYDEVRSNREKIQQEIDKYVAANGNLAPLAPGQDEKYWTALDPFQSDEEEETKPKGNGKRAQLSPITDQPDRNGALEGSIQYYEDIIKQIETALNTLDLTFEERTGLKSYMETLKGNVAILQGEFKKISEAGLELTPDEKLEIDDFLNTEGIMKGMKSLSDVLGQDQQALMMEFSSQYEWDYEQFLKWSEAKMQQAEKEGKVQKEQLAEYLRVGSDVLYNVGQLFAAQSDRKIAKLEEEMAIQDEYYKNAIEAEEGNAERQAELRAEQKRNREKLQKEANREKEEQARKEKMFTAFDIILNTAAAVAEFGFITPMGIAAAAMGALQLATVLSTPVPKYAKGRKGGKEELAITGDGGKQEVITDKHGKFKALTPKTPTLTYLAKDDRVFPDIPSFQEEYSYEDLKRASVMTSLQDQQQKLSSAEAQNNFNMNLMLDKIEKRIESGFSKAKITNKNVNDNSGLVKELTSAIKNQNLRDKI